MTQRKSGVISGAAIEKKRVGSVGRPTVGALDEMSLMSIGQLIELRNVCEIMNETEEARNHQPD